MRVWFVRAGNANVLEDMVEAKQAVALGWAEIGDLSKFESRNEFIDAYRKVYPAHVSGKVTINAGQLFRFAHELHRDDYVITPLKAEAAYLVGLVVGEYEYDQTIFSSQYPHIRRINWKSHLRKQDFSKEAVKSMGSILAVFNIDPYLEEIAQLLKTNNLL